MIFEMLELADLVDKYQLDLILMFGSRVTGNVHPDSDIDIAIYGGQIFSEAEKVQLTYELCSIFRTDDIDLVDLRTAPPLLKYEVFKNYKALFQRDPMLLYRLELANIHEMKELDAIYRIRRERLREFVK
jgi:predicted nucleotidyltransferase